MVWDFEVAETGNYALAGVIHHNSGKSVSVAMEFARRVTGLPIFDSKGRVIQNPWPVASANFPRVYWIIGWDTDHIGQTIHRLLFQPGMGGQLRVIQDEITGEWRVWNRANPRDRQRNRASRLAGPLIPERMIIQDSWEWENKRGNQFASVRLTNGASIFAYPSSARNPKQGEAVSGIWIDEDIQFAGHLKEWQDRLTDEEGWFLWSVWPHVSNEALLGLIDRARVEEFEEKPNIKAFQLIMTDNPYLTDTGKEQALGRMGSEEEQARRNRGELLEDTINMYSLVPARHLIRKPDIMARDVDTHPLVKTLAEYWDKHRQWPKNWTRYLSIDPSHTRTACHSWVVPPEQMILHDQRYEVGNLVICEWELVARRYTAPMLAKALRELMGGHAYEAFIMDQQAGRQTHAGRQENTFEVFAKALEEAGIASRLTGPSFLPGCPVPTTRYRAVRSLLGVQPDCGIPSVLFVEERCLETKKEFSTYRKKNASRGGEADGLLDEPALPRLHDCMASMEYMLAYLNTAFIEGHAYTDPVSFQKRGSPAAKLAAEWKQKQSKQEDGVVWLGAGGYSDRGPSF